MAEPWWGRFEIPAGGTGRFKIGPLILWAQRLTHEWRFFHESGDDPLDATLEVRIPVDPLELATDLEVTRFGFRSCPDSLRLTPVPADRPLVANPEQSVQLPSGEELVIYVSSPLWVRIEVGEPDVRLHEVPTYRPTDTWFGPTTLSGELCYAARTSARLHLDDLPVRPHRAITAVTVRNRSTGPLPLENLKLPMPSLSLFESDGRLWTEAVTFEHGNAGELAKMRVEGRPPRDVDASRKVSGPRLAPNRGILTWAFGGLRRGDPQ